MTNYRPLRGSKIIDILKLSFASTNLLLHSPAINTLGQRYVIQYMLLNAVTGFIAHWKDRIQGLFKEFLRTCSFQVPKVSIKRHIILGLWPQSH